MLPSRFLSLLLLLQPVFFLVQLQPFLSLVQILSSETLRVNLREKHGRKLTVKHCIRTPS